MGHNRAGVRAKQKARRHKREEARLALKAAGGAVKAEPAQTATPNK